jgi:hypothetical protein
MFDQKNQQLQTLILSSTVMFAALSTIIVQGYLPNNVNKFMAAAFGLFCGISFAFLVISLVLCVEIMLLASRFMLNRAVKIAQNVEAAREDTDRLFFKVIKKNFNLEPPEPDYYHNKQAENSSASLSLNAFDDNMNRLNMVGSISRREYLSQRHRIFADNFKSIAKSENNVNVDELWRDIERGQTSLMTDRRGIIHSFLPSKAESFEMFWKRRCDFESEIALFCFYGGTGTMLLSVLIFLYEQFTVTYSNSWGGYLGCSCIALSLIFSFYIARKFKQRHAGDINEGMYVKVRPKRTVSYWLCKLFYHPYPWRRATIIRKYADQSYKIRYIHETFHHFENHVQESRIIHDIYGEGNKVLVRLPGISGYFNQWKCGQIIECVNDDTYTIKYDNNDIENNVNERRLKVIESFDHSEENNNSKKNDNRYDGIALNSLSEPLI